MVRVHIRYALLLVLCSASLTGCHSARLKNPEGRRLRLVDCDAVALHPVEAVADADRPGLCERLTSQIRDQLSQSSWAEAPTTTAPAPDASGRQIALTVTIVKARYPSRSKIIWLGSSHKMTCRLEVYDHAGGHCLGSGKVSTSVEPLMGNAALLNFGWLGIAGRTLIDTRKHDADLLISQMARDIVKALDRARR